MDTWDLIDYLGMFQVLQNCWLHHFHGQHIFKVFICVSSAIFDSQHCYSEYCLHCLHMCKIHTHTNGFLPLLALQVPQNLVWLFYNAASQKLFPARTLFEDLVCDVLSMIVLSHMNTQLILADYCKVLRLHRPENSPHIYIFFPLFSYHHLP